MIDPMTTYIVETWRAKTADGSPKVSSRIMLMGVENEWRYKRHTFAEWDWSNAPIRNQHIAAIRTIRMDIQKDPIDCAIAGGTKRGILWVVTVSR